MGLMDFTLRRIAPAAGASALAAWAGITTLNDDWDDYFRPSGAPEPEKIVILGSGWAALNVLRKCASPGKSIVVVSPRPHFLYTPLLASSSVGTITLRSACEPLRALVEGAAGRCESATYVRACASEVDVIGKRVLASTGVRGKELELSYDKLVIAVGSEPNTFGVPGVAEHALFMKEAQDSANLHARLLGNLEKASALNHEENHKYDAEIDRLLKVVVVGGGPTGVELCAELSDFRDDIVTNYGKDIAEHFKVILVQGPPRILPPYDEFLANAARDRLISKGVEVRTGTAVTRVGRKDVVLEPRPPRNATPEQRAAASQAATTEEVGAVVWSAGIGARPFIKRLARGLGQENRKGLKVDENLKIVGCQDVYAIGDASLTSLPPTAQVAQQQGKHVGRAIRDGKDSKFEFNYKGSMVCLGSDSAIAQLLMPEGPKKFSIWDSLGVHGVGKDHDQVPVKGVPALVLWRWQYWTGLLGNRTRLSLTTDWLQSQLLGRDVEDQPVMTPRKHTTLGQRVESLGTDLKRNRTIRFVNRKKNQELALATNPVATNSTGANAAADDEKKKRFWFF